MVVVVVCDCGVMVAAIVVAPIMFVIMTMWCTRLEFVVICGGDHFVLQG